MSDMNLIPQFPLGGMHLEIGALTITEVTDRAIVSIAVPKKGRNKLAKAVAAKYKGKLPAIGLSTQTEVANGRFLGMQQDQYFLLWDQADGNPIEQVTARLGARGYFTDQSDAWVMIRFSGPDSRDALARICPIDLHPDRFLMGQVARTVMEHLGVIIVREDDDTFLLMSPRSSAGSFLHALKTSAQNVG